MSDDLRPTAYTFREFHRLTPNLPADRRARCFLALPLAWQEPAWSKLAEQVAFERWSKEDRPMAVTTTDPARKSRAVIVSSSLASGDPLLTVSPPIYVEALTGEPVPASGFIRCPLHEERTPSFKAYNDPERGWHCFGCGRGGTVYDLGGALWNYATRGDDFKRLRRELALVLLRETV